jgi:hypothetical protein
MSSEQSVLTVMHNLKTKKEDFQILVQIMEWLLQLAFFTDLQIQYNNFCSAKNDFTNNLKLLRNT